MSVYGHIRDLKKKELSVDLDTLEANYEIPEEKKKVVSELKKNAKAAKKVWLASDEDREGEANKLAPLRSLVSTKQNKSHCVPRNYETSHSCRHSESPSFGYEPCKRTASTPVSWTV